MYIFLYKKILVLLRFFCEFLIHQIGMILLEDLVLENHIYRKFDKLLSFKSVEKKIQQIDKETSHKGYNLFQIFKCLLLQFMENLSDPKLERFIQENIAARWFCGFNLKSPTPDSSIFPQARELIGTKALSEIFSDFKRDLQQQGVMGDVLNFLDSADLLSKSQRESRTAPKAVTTNGN